MKENLTVAIDIAHWWQVDWAEVPEYVRVVFIKATEGDYFLDPSLERHVEGALEAGKIVGLYHFYRTRISGRVVPAQAQAEYFLHHTRSYWPEVNLRANDFERSHFVDAAGEYYNPCLGTEAMDLRIFHQALHESGWAAFDLLYTNPATWAGMKMETAANLWQGPAWIKEQPYLDGLWLAWWPYRRPKAFAGLQNFDPAAFSPRLPRPFTDYWMWQVAADYRMPGLYTSDGRAPKSADLSIIPHAPAEVAAMLGAYQQGAEAGVDIKKMMAAYRAGWRVRTDRLIEYLQQTRDVETE